MTLVVAALRRMTKWNKVEQMLFDTVGLLIFGLYHERLRYQTFELFVMV